VEYASEKEQVEVLKKWWKENGKAIIAGVLIGVGGIVGWRTWEAKLVAKATEASAGYQQMISNVAEEKIASAKRVGQRLVAEFEGTPYAVFAALMLAKIAVDQEELDSAREYLQWAADNSELPALRQTARLRLARLMLIQGSPEQAWSVLSSIEDADDLPSYQELKGDILIAQNDTEGARMAYRQALELQPAGNTELLELKLDDLGEPPAGGRAPSQ
jgi:predicted negative regulator of RcsB-dependent stress response